MVLKVDFEHFVSLALMVAFDWQHITFCFVFFNAELHAELLLIYKQFKSAQLVCQASLLVYLVTRYHIHSINWTQPPSWLAVLTNNVFSCWRRSVLSAVTRATCVRRRRVRWTSSRVCSAHRATTTVHRRTTTTRTTTSQARTAARRWNSPHRVLPIHSTWCCSATWLVIFSDMFTYQCSHPIKMFVVH